MQYDFTSIMDRKGHDAIAVDAVGAPGSMYPAPREGFDVIPMWIADMNFPTVPTIPQAIIERTEHAAYGYFAPRKEYFDAIASWHERRKGVAGVEPQYIGYANGVLAGVVAAANVLCSRGDKILVHSPTYVGFTHALGDNGYELVHSPLVLDEENVWRMDFEDMERKLVEQKIHTAILCTPHNPCGRVWERWELEKAMELFKMHDVFVISDEIWSDLILPGHKHIPTQSLSEDAKQRTVAMYAPSKTFNLAGLVGSYSVVYNKWLKDRMDKEMSLSHCNGMNVLSMYALIGGYSPEGSEWVDQLVQVIDGNVRYAVSFINERFDGVTVSRPQGTYMLFVDCAGWLEKNGRTIDQLKAAFYEVGVMVQDGRQFQAPTSLRMNLALPLSRVKEAFERLDKYVFNK
ncbi:MAG: aminotransferase class I/II-fold pyridoxal phosphate-dependent enzyme [Clostridia bacterium]|nr:aminotransferase class I/II-fold pyridoxal phosphate-dependent enzyme [Clostridia bacterium]